jgi:phosphoribosyl-ATP pyrophosphohydrolase/phosphoribosyl-AMP cyclohydrolase
MPVRFDDRGLVPGIVQNASTGAVLMIAYLNEEALEATRLTGEVHFWSRSRNELWRKGATSGNTMTVRRIREDCDGDALLIEAQPAGPACHTGETTCFGPDDTQGFAALEDLWSTIVGRAANRPEGSYTTHLLDNGPDAPARKVLEEAGEVAFAAKDHAAGSGDARRVVEESADLIYHLLVLLADRGIDPSDVISELRKRAGQP